MTVTFQDAVKAFRQLQGGKQNILKSWPAYVGNEDGTVSGNRPGYIFARYPGTDSPAYEVYNGNSGVGWVAGVKIMVGIKSSRPDLVQVLDEADARNELAVGSTTTIYEALKPHAQQHMWGYSDPVYILFRQITNLGIYVDTSASFKVTLMAGAIPLSTGIINVAQSSIDLTTHVPAGGARYVLISINNSGTPVLTDGSIISPVNSLNPATDMPVTPAGNYRVAAIRLYTGQSSINDTIATTDVFDLRFPPEYWIPTLTNNHIFVGDSTNHAADVAMSGDATIANTGAVTLATVNSNVGTFGDASHISRFTVNGKGLITAASNIALANVGYHIEVVMDGGTPPSPVLTPDGYDWIYAYVPD